MKTSLLTFWSMGRSLVRLKDRTGAYKLPTGNPFPKFGATGRRGAELPSAVRAPAPVPQPSLFEEAAKPPTPAPIPTPAPVRIPAPPPCDLPTPPPHEVGNADCSVQGNRGQDASPGPAQNAPSQSQPPVAPQARRFSFMLHFPFTILHSLKARLARVFHFGSHSLAHDSRPRAQAELALEKVTVLRNDLSESDLVVVTVERKMENPEVRHPAASRPGNPGTRPAARWIQLKGQSAPGDSEPAPRRTAQMVETHP